MFNPSNYNHPVIDPIILEETHVSLVFLTGEYAYKVKKDVVFGEILDYSTITKRQYFCHKEVELNCRLTKPGFYLGVVALTDNGISDELDSQFEFAVKMKEYPQECQLNNYLDAGNALKESHMLDLAKQLSEFHDKTDKVPNAGSMDIVRHKIEENFRTVGKLKELNQPYIDKIQEFMSNNLALFEARIQNNRITDNHGDVQPRNIFIVDEEIIIYDCIDFNPHLRQGDVTEEVAFLAMEVDKYNLNDLSNYFVDKYVELSGDKELYKLINFYKSYRAYVRGKVWLFNSQSVDEELIDDMIHESEEYFKLAHSYFLDVQ
jgi:hypothetical protein